MLDHNAAGSPKMPSLELAHGLAFEDLYRRDGVARIDALFLQALGGSDATLRGRLESARAAPDAIDKKTHSQLLVDVAPHVEDFVAALFGIQAEVQALAARHSHVAPLYHCKRQLVQRKAAKKYKPDEAGALDGDALRADLERRFG